jgi:hypothetical protein
VENPNPSIVVVLSKFIVLSDSMKSAIKMAREHGGADFQSRFDKSTGQAQEMKEGGAAGFVISPTPRPRLARRGILRPEEFQGVVNARCVRLSGQPGYYARPNRTLL